MPAAPLRALLALALAPALIDGCEDDLCTPLPREYMCSLGYTSYCTDTCEDDLCAPLPREYMCSLGLTSYCTSVEGDPHFRGAHGDRFDFSGLDNAVYALLSAKDLALNALFSKASFVMGGTCKQCTAKQVHGSFIKAVYFRARTTTGKTLTVEYKADEPSRATLTELEAGKESVPFLAASRNLGVSQSMPDTVTDETDGVSVSLTRKNAREAAVAVRTAEYELRVASLYIGFAEQNGYKKRLDVNIVPLHEVALYKVAPHGLLGQTFDADQIAVDGALDDYSPSVVYTKAMGEGAIQGVAADYEIPRDDPFSTRFKYDRFNLLHAPPRDIAALSGVRRHVAASDKLPQLSATGDEALLVTPLPVTPLPPRPILFSA